MDKREASPDGVFLQGSADSRRGPTIQVLWILWQNVAKERIEIRDWGTTPPKGKRAGFPISWQACGRNTQTKKNFFVGFSDLISGSLVHRTGSPHATHGYGVRI